MLLSQTRQRSAPLSPVLPSATLPLPRQFPFTPGFQQGPTANGIASQADQLRFHADRRELEAIQLRELQCPNALRRGMEARSVQVLHIPVDSVQEALSTLLTVPPGRPCPVEISSLARVLGIHIRPHPVATSNGSALVDVDGNPWTEYILTFVDTFLVLYRSVPDHNRNHRYNDHHADPETKAGEEEEDDGDWEDRDEMDKKAYAATLSTKLAASILTLIPYTHRHVLRAMWFASLYLTMAYGDRDGNRSDARGGVESKRGVALSFLLDRVEDQLMKTKGGYGPDYGTGVTTLVQGRDQRGGQDRVAWERNNLDEDGIWTRRFRNVRTLRSTLRGGKITVAMIWAEMKGISGAGVHAAGAGVGLVSERKARKRVRENDTEVAKRKRRSSSLISSSSISNLIYDPRYGWKDGYSDIHENEHARRSLERRYSSPGPTATCARTRQIPYSMSRSISPRSTDPPLARRESSSNGSVITVSIPARQSGPKIHLKHPPTSNTTPIVSRSIAFTLSPSLSPVPSPSVTLPISNARSSPGMSGPPAPEPKCM